MEERARMLGAAGACSLLLSCGPLDAASAFDGTTYTCTAEERDSWSVQVETCREDPACPGWASFRGSLEGIPVVVNGPLLDSGAVHLIRIDDTTIRTEIQFAGVTPYFEFEYKLLDGGGLIGDAFAPFTVEIVQGESVPDDGTGRITFRVSNRVQSVDQPARRGWFGIDVQRQTEGSGHFHAYFGADEADELEGCFHVFFDEVTVDVEVADP